MFWSFTPESEHNYGFILARISPKVLNISQYNEYGVRTSLFIFLALNINEVIKLLEVDRMTKINV